MLSCFLDILLVWLNLNSVGVFVVLKVIGVLSVIVVMLLDILVL